MIEGIRISNAILASASPHRHPREPPAGRVRGVGEGDGRVLPPRRFTSTRDPGWPNTYRRPPGRGWAQGAGHRVDAMITDNVGGNFRTNPDHRGQGINIWRRFFAGAS